MAVRLLSLTKRFGDVVAVDQVSFDVAGGEFFSLLGPSGCGKTTTLRMIGGFDAPDSGTIALGGVDVSALPPHRRDVNTVFQSYALFPHLDVFENVAYGLRRRRKNNGDIARSVGEMLRIVSLPGLEKRRTSQLSGGQQQRVALARALVNHPQVLLLDEPLGALDLKLRRQMQLELKRIQHEVGITFIYVTHDQEEAMTMSDRIAVMNQGRIEQIGAPHDVYERPATEFVAGFLGTANLLDGVVRSRENGLVTIELTNGGTVRAAAAHIDGNDRVRVGMRPEKIRIDEGAPANGHNTLRGKITTATFTGVSYTYAIQTPDGATLTVVAQNAGERARAPGEDVTLTWLPEHTFAVKPTGERDDI